MLSSTGPSHTLCFLMIILSFVGCSRARAPYPESDRWPYEYRCRLIEPELSHEMVFEDEDLAITFSIGDTRIGFMLRNKTDGPIRILWEKSSYLDGGGYPFRIIHRDVEYAEKDGPLSPTVLPPGSDLSTEVLPEEYVFYVEYEDEWIESRLFPGEQELQPMYKGTIFGLLLMLEIRGVPRPYTFRFKISEVRRRHP